MNFIDQWNDIEIIGGDPCNHELIDVNNPDGMREPYVAIIFVTTVFACMIIVIRFTYSKRFPRNEQQIEQHSIQISMQTFEQQSQQSAQYSSCTQYEEPEYFYIASMNLNNQSEQYDHLNFNLLPLSPALLHYDHYKNAQKESSCQPRIRES